MTWDSIVNVVNNPELTLDVGKAVYTSGSGTTVLTFQYTVLDGHDDLDLSYGDATAITLVGGSTILDVVGNSAILDTPDNLTGNSLGDNRNITIDTTEPVLQFVIASPVSGSYNDPNGIDIQVHYDEPIVVTNTPRITLETGVSDAVVNFSAVTAETLTFNYTIADGDNSLDLTYNNGSAIDLNTTGVIADLAGNTPVSLVMPNNGGTDSLGDRSAVIVDTVHPTIAVTSPATSSYIFEGNDSATFSVTGNCSEASQDVTVVIGGSDVTTAQVAQCNGTTFSVTFDSTALANNTVHTVAAKVSDAAGNLTTSATVSVTRDITDPTLAVTTPTTGAYFNENTDSAIYSVLGTCSESTQNVTVLIDGSAVTTAQVSQCNGTNYSITFDSTALANNTTFTLGVRMNDAAGNSNDSATISVTRDITKPAAPTGLTVAVGTNSASVIPSFTWTESTDPQKAGQEVALDAAATGGNSEDGWDPIGEGTTTASFPSVASAPLSECTDYYPSVRVYDDAGNVSTVTANQPIRVDTVLPTVAPVFSEAGGATPSKTPEISIDTAAVDACGIQRYEIRISHDNGDGTGTAGDQILDDDEKGNLFNWYDVGLPASFPKKIDGQSFLPGNWYFFEIRAVDWGGNPSPIYESSAFEVEVNVVGNFQTGTTHVPTTGSNRYLFFFVSLDDDIENPDADLTNVTYGTQPMTGVCELHVQGTSAWDTRVEIFMIDDAGITAAEALGNQNFVMTYDFPGQVRPNYSSLMLEGVNQASAIYSSATGFADNAGNFTASGLNELKKGITLAVVGNGDGGPSTIGFNTADTTDDPLWTTSGEFEDGSGQTTHEAGYLLPAADATGTAYQFSFSSNRRNGACIIHVAP